ncbi:MAG: dienelactone hydrolase family protein, partial [Pseudomonadota bacterium]
MKEKHVDIATKDGAMNTFITHPEEGGPFPAVLFYMDAPGKREELHDMARRIATVGYYVVLPNLYYRDTREFHLGMPGATREQMFEMMNRISNQMACEDTQAMLDYVADDAQASPGPVGTVGYCMSGPFVFAAAA